MAVYTVGVEHLLGRILQHAVIAFAYPSTVTILVVFFGVALCVLPTVCVASFSVELFVFLVILSLT